MSQQDEVQQEQPVVTSSVQDDEPAAPAKGETPEAEAKDTDEQAESADGDSPDQQHDEDEDNSDSEQERKPLPRGVQRKINKLTKRSAEAERRAQELERQLEQMQRNAPQKPPEPPQGKPTLEQFDYDQDRYLEALADYRLEQKIGQLRQQSEQRQREQQQRERSRTLAERESAFIADHPDYEEVAKDPSLPINEVMAEAIFEADDPPAIAYYLGQNPDEAMSISQLSPVAAARAIGRIEAKLSVPGQPPKRTTKAPPPVTTLQSSAPIKRDLSELRSMDEYVAERKRQRKAQGL